MQLKLRVGVGDSITIDVQATDTFQDLSDRLFQLAGVQVDLSQLKSNDKPFNMTTNVIQYFTPKPDKVEHETEDDLKTPKLCRLCSESISHDPQFLFEPRDEEMLLVEKVNAALPIHVTVKDQLPKQICTTCLSYLNNSYDFMLKVVKAQKCLENVYSVKDSSYRNYPSGESCPLCMVGRLKSLENKNSAGNGTSGNSIKKESVVKKEVIISVPRNQNIKKETIVNNNINNRYVKPQDLMFEEDEMVGKEYYYEDEVVTEYWDGSVPNELMGMKKYRKRPKVEDDADWTIDEEYVPVSRRGRPKGTKNKPKVQTPVVEKSCVLCGWLGAETDIFAHAINQHCQPDMNYFPCPLCKSKQLNEMVLETHINRHILHAHSKASTSS